MVSHLENAWEVSVTKVKPEISPREMKIYVHITHIKLTAALFIIIKNRKQLRCPSIGE